MSIRTRTSGIMTMVAPTPTTVTPMAALIAGLATDGLTAKLDRLWIWAQATDALALVDIIAGATATAVNTPTFTANVGYTGDGGTSYLDSNFNPTTAPAPKYIQDSASVFAWSNTAGMDAGAIVGISTINKVRIFPAYIDTNTYWGVNTNVTEAIVLGGGAGQTGLWLATRTAAAAQRLDVNGSNAANGVTASVPPLNENIWCLREATLYSARQVCCFGIGGQLSATDSTNLYNRLRTYMTAVGVP